MMYSAHVTSRRFVTMLLALVIALALVGVSAACPTCKDSLAQHDPDSANMVRGYFWSIIFMMSMPFLILGGLGSYLYLEVRRARLRKQFQTQPLAAFMRSADSVAGV